MKLTMLGTGNALVTECYNTCFVLESDGQYLLVDGGGGNTVLHQLKHAGFRWQDMHDIFVTHKHVDHVMGVVWMMRMITQFMAAGRYEGEARIYAHKELADALLTMADMLLQGKQLQQIGPRLHVIVMEDGQELTLVGRPVRVFDIGSTKTKQFGFVMTLPDGGKLTCCGDEPLNDARRDLAQGSKWLLHEAFCLYSEAAEFKPYEKHHSTVKDACELAESLHVQNLLLYHTEDKNLTRRKSLYAAEGTPFFSGNLFIPDDLETLEL